MVLKMLSIFTMPLHIGPQSLRYYLAKNSVTTLDYPRYLPDLGPADFFLKTSLKGERFAGAKVITELLESILSVD